MNSGSRLNLAPLLIVAVIILFKWLSAPTVVDPETGRKIKVGMSPEQEQSLGLESYQQVLQENRQSLIQTGPQFDMVRRVAKNLAAATGKDGAGFQWSVSLIDSQQVNAFCLPGGKIVVYTGLLPVTKAEAPLAAVMGHEMAHATLHHGAQRVLREGIIQTAVSGAAGSLGSMDPAQQRTVMGMLGAGAQFGLSLPFSRGNESEADARGLLYMARAGYNPEEVIPFWQRMEEASKGQSPPEIASDHPAHATRIHDLQEIMPQMEEEYHKALKRTGGVSPATAPPTSDVSLPSKQPKPPLESQEEDDSQSNPLEEILRQIQHAQRGR
jgi:predicted Zn-dependent protease